MTEFESHDSIGGIRSLMSQTDEGQLAFSQQFDIDYDKFCNTVEKALARYIKFLENNPYDNGTKTENQLNIDIVNMLNAGYFNAFHGPYTGGHTDVMVRNHNDPTQIWIGEGKVNDSGISVILEGFKQISTRYLNGKKHSCRGGLLIYSHVMNSVNVMNVWRSYVLEKNYVIHAEPIDSDISFLTLHESEGSGLSVQIRHFIATLHFDAKDKSGIKSSKGRSLQLILDFEQPMAP